MTAGSTKTRPRTIRARRSDRAHFREQVFTVVSSIPRGKTLTYKEVATRAGNPKAARAVGALLKTNYDSAIPCHRVVRSDGTPGGYNRGYATKVRLLREESLQRVRK